MERQFIITMHVPLGSRHGTMHFTEDRSKIHGVMEVLGNKDSFTGKLTKSGNIEITGKMTSLLHSFSYRAKGTIKNSKMNLSVVGDRYSFCITGEETNIQEDQI